MAKTSQRVRQARPAKYKTRAYTRCRRCSRARSGRVLHASVVRADLDEARQLFVLACQYSERIITRDDYDALATDPDWTLKQLLEP